MTIQIDAGGVAGKDLVFELQLFDAGKPINLSDYTPSVVVKAARTATDDSGTAYGVGSGLVIVSALLGRVRLTLPASATATPGTTWFRCDVSANDQSFPVLMGNLVLIPA